MINHYEGPKFQIGQCYEVRLVFYIGLNNSDSKGQKNAKLWGFEPCNLKPDLDNLEKFYLDCASGILFQDDRMIISLQSKKKYDKNPRTEIIVMPKKELNLEDKVKSALKLFGPDRLKEFLEDAKKIERTLPADFEEHEGDLRREWLTSCATTLISFADKYSDDLKKIKCKAALHTESYGQGKIPC